MLNKYLKMLNKYLKMLNRKLLRVWKYKVSQVRIILRTAHNDLIIYIIINEFPFLTDVYLICKVNLNVGIKSSIST